MTTVEPHSREDQLFNTVRRTLESRNYEHESPVVLKQGSTHSLKELLISSSVDMESTTNTSITALCSIDTKPMDSVESFERLCQFCSGSSAHKQELFLVLYPVFVHVYLDLIAGGHSGIAESFMGKHSAVFTSSHKAELHELSEVVSAEQVAVNALAKKFRSQKFCLRMTSSGFQLLMQCLQMCQTPGLLSLIQRYLNIDVYGNTLVTSADNSIKPEKKGSHSLIFIKPRIPRLEVNPQIHKKKEWKVSDANEAVVPCSFGKLASSSSLSSTTFHLPRDNKSSSLCTELREKMAASSQQLSPSLPSLALYTVHCPADISAHCAAISPSSDLYACGFSDSSVQLWSHLPVESCSRNQPSPPAPECCVLRGHHGPVYGVGFDTSGQFLLSSSEDCTVRLWSTKHRSTLASYRGHSHPVWDVTYSPVDVYFGTASLDRTARLWTTDLVYPLRIFAGHTASVDVVVFHSNGKYIATGSRDHSCRLWDIQTGHNVRLMTGSKCPITSLAFSPNGKQLVSGDESGSVRVWDIGSGAVIREVSEGSSVKRASPVSSLAFSSDCSLLASTSLANHVNICSFKSLEPPHQLSYSYSSACLSRHQCSVDTLLQLNFTHRNCLVALGISSSKASTLISNSSNAIFN